MDKQKNKDDLRAAGKKRLELFRAKRSKAGASKTAASTQRPAVISELHPGELNEENGNSTSTPPALVDPVQAELQINDAVESNHSCEMPCGEQEDPVIHSIDPGKGTWDIYDQTGILAVHGNCLEVDETAIRHSEKLAETHCSQTVHETENNDECTQAESTRRAAVYFLEEQKSKELYETEKDTYPVYFQHIDPGIILQQEDKLLQMSDDIVDVSILQQDEVHSSDNTIQMDHFGPQVTISATLHLSSEVEELKGQVDRVMKEKHELLSELEQCKKELFQLIEDRNRIRNDLEEISKEGAVFKAEIHHKLVQEKQLLIENWNDVEHKIKNIYFADVFSHDKESVNTDGEHDISYLKHELESDISHLASVFREANEQLQVKNSENARLRAQVEHVLSELEEEKKENTELLHKAGETSQYLQNLEMEKGDLKAQLALAQETEIQLQLKLSESQQHLNRALSEVEALASNFEKLQLYHEQANIDKTEVERRLDEKQQELLQAKIDFEELANFLAKYKEQMKEREEKVQMEKLQLQKILLVNEKNELENKARQCTELHEKLECLENELDVQRRERALAVSERDNAVADLETLKEQLEKIVEQLAALTIDNKLEVTKMSEEKQTLEEQICYLEHRLSSWDDKNLQLNAELNGHVQQLKIVGLENSKLSQGLKESHYELAQLKEELLNSFEYSKKKAEVAEQREVALISQLSEVHLQLQTLNEEKEQLLADFNKQAKVAKVNEIKKHDLEIELTRQISLACIMGEKEHMLLAEISFYKEQVNCIEEQKLELIHMLQETRKQLQDLQKDVAKDKACTEISRLDQSTTTLQMQELETIEQLENESVKMLNPYSEDIQKGRDELDHQCGEISSKLQKAEEENLLVTRELKPLHRVASLVEWKEPDARCLLPEKKLPDLEEQLTDNSLSSQLEIAMQQVELLKKEKEQVLTQLGNDKLCLQVYEEQLQKFKNEATLNRQLLQELELSKTQLRNDLDVSFLYVQKLSDIAVWSVFELECLKVQQTLVTNEKRQELEKSERTFQEIEDGKWSQNDLERLRHQCEEAEAEIDVLRGYMDAVQQNSKNIKSLNHTSEHLDMILSDSGTEEKTFEKFDSGENITKTEVQVTIQDLQHHVIKFESSHPGNEANMKVAELTSLKCEKRLGEVLSGNQFVGSTNHIRSGVSKLIEAFEAKTRTKDELTIGISEDPAHVDTVGGIGVIQTQRKGMKADEGTSCQTHDLRQVTEDGEYLWEALRQEEVEAGLLRQKEELEKRIILLVEKNAQLVGQLVRCTDDISSLEIQAIEVQERTTKELTDFQDKLEDLQENVFQHAMLSQAERTTYLVAIARLERKMEMICQSVFSCFPSDSYDTAVCSGAEVCVDDLTMRLEALHNRLDSWNLCVCQMLTANQLERDAAFELVHYLCTKLHQILKINRNNIVKDQKHAECSAEEGKTEGTQEVCESRKSDTNLDALRLEFNHLVTELQFSLQSKFDLEAAVRDLTVMLSGKDANIKEITMKLDKLTVEYDHLCVQVQMDTKEKLKLQDEIQLIQEGFVEKSEMHNSLCLNINALATKILNATDIDVTNNETGKLSRDINFLDSHITTLIDRYGSVVRELEELKHKMALKEAETTRSNHELHKSYMELDTIKKEKENLEQCMEELSRAREDREKVESELMQTEQKLSVVKEKLSVAVTKGKAIVHQRDALKQALLEKNAELEKMIWTHEHELQLKSDALCEAESKLRSFAEIENRIETLQLESRQAEEEKAYLESVRQVEVETGLLKQDQLEKRVALLVEMNDQILRQLVRGTADIGLLENEMLDLQERTTKKLVNFQKELENLNGEASEVAFSLQAERDAYLVAIDRLEKRMEAVVQSDFSSFPSDSGYAVPFSGATGAEACVDHLVKKLEAILNCFDGWHVGVTELLVANRQEHDAAFELLHSVCRKLYQALWLNHSNTAEKQTHVESSIEEVKTGSTHQVLEYEISSTDLRGICLECNDLVDELQKPLQEKFHSEAVVRELTAMLSGKDTTIQDLTVKLDELMAKYDFLCFKAGRDSEEKLLLQEKILQMHKRFTENSELYDSLCSNTNTSATKNLNAADLGVPDHVADNLSRHINFLDFHITNLIEKYGNAFSELDELKGKMTLKEAEAIQLVALKEAEVKRLDEQACKLNMELDTANKERECLKECMEELSRARKDRERIETELMQTGQKLTITKEKLSLAVTKGKSVVQQRDALKLSLMEKNGELEKLMHTHEHELRLKSAILHDAELKSRSCEEFEDRIEALQSELAYIRNSANVLRESFLQKDAALQKVEELLEGLNLPDEVYRKEIVEKIEWLLGTFNVQTLTQQIEQKSFKEIFSKFSETTGDHADGVAAESTHQEQEIEVLKRDYEELMHKYRTLAEQSAMLEQSLLERNYLIQRWEEVLNTIDMPNVLRSMEPEDKIEWLGRTLIETQNLAKQLQNNLHSSEGALEMLRHDYDESCKQRNALLTDLLSKTKDSEMLATDLQNVTGKYELLTAQLEQASAEMINRESLETEVSVLRRSVTELMTSQEIKVSELKELQSAFVSTKKIIAEGLQQSDTDSILSERGLGSLSADLKISVRRLVDDHKEVTNELENLKKQLLIMEKEKEECSTLEHESLRSLQEAIELKDLEIINFRRNLEDAVSCIEPQEMEINELRHQSTRLTEAVTSLKDEKDKLVLELNQTEQKLTSTREKLSMAVKKGKNVVQQRDAMKLDLDHVKQQFQTQDAMLQEAHQRLSQLEGAIDRAEKLEIELSVSRDAVTSMEHSLWETNAFIQKLVGSIHKRIPGSSQAEDPIQKVEWLIKMLNESEEKTLYFEQESLKASQAMELLTVELKEAHVELRSIRDEYMDARKKISTFMEENAALEAVKKDLLLYLEQARANSRTLADEVTVLKKFKADSQHEIRSLQDKLVTKMEELRCEQIETDRQHRDLIDLHANLGDLKDKQAHFLLTFVEDKTESTKDMTKLEVLARNLASLVAALKDSGTDSTANSDFFTPIMKQTSSVRGQMTLHECAVESSAVVGSTQWSHDDLTTSIRLQYQEMIENMENFKEKFHCDASVFTQGLINISNLLVHSCSLCGSIAEKMEKLQTDVSRVNFFEALMQEREMHVSELQATVKCLSDATNAAIQDLEHIILSMSPEQMKGSTNLYIASQNSTNELETLSRVCQEQVDTSRESAINTCSRLLSVVKKMSSIHEHTLSQRNKELMMVNLRREESERNCKELQDALTETQTMLNGLISQERSCKFKIINLEKVIANAESDNLSLKLKLNEFQASEVNTIKMKKEIDSLQNLLLHKDEEQEGLAKVLHAAETKVEVLASKVKDLERDMQEKSILVESLEASRVKASNRLSITVRKLNGLQKMSERLLLEVENLHKLLENRDAEIYQLKQYYMESENKIKVLEDVIDGRNDDLFKAKKRLQGMIHNFSVQDREPSSTALEASEESGLQDLTEILDMKRSSFLEHAQDLQTQLEKKDSLLQDVRYRFEEQLGKMNALHAIIHEKQAQIERLSAQGNDLNTTNLITSNEIEDLGQHGKRIVPLISASPVILNARKQSTVDHQVLDVDLYTSRKDLDIDDDKGHMFKTLTSSRFVPKASRIVADRLDGFWVASGRVLMRQPEARLGLFVYWFALHIWIATLLL